LITYTQKEDVIKFNVRVVPRASKSEIVGEHDGALKVRIASPPVDGAANEELIKFLAKSFGVTRSAVEILSGHSSRLKKVAITGASPEKTALILQAKI
jgi:uncharacterized protein (TIGR00251 family)